ncbi:WBM0748 family T4SS-associated protein [Wolbachia endosymbiont of Trichogramma pretiosum]|uniref:WBM0748 family T4SS-associated protein n=1 Tax=Wolbachia endosymbiont of Trichogramma pretiosum TaxID=125593 RepID=UPI000A683F2B|nr:hypothetical protein [Wolbachia endosymbiont of Trichogramma pretiosum]OCA06453.1 hypothetical protein wTpre_787 [Wolbachia endosymbiont of Trichogramma pretiosum]
MIEQQLGIKYHDNCLAYTIHNSSAGEISDSIALCIVGCGNYEIKYQGIANLFNITKEEINQSNIESIKNKIESEARKEGSEFSELISRMDQSLKEQSEKSIIRILNSSAEKQLRSFCGSSIQRTEDKEVSLSSASHEEPTTEDSETTINSDLLSI